MRIILQSSLLTLFCIFLDSTGAQNKKLKAHDIQKDSEKKLAQSVAGQKFSTQNGMISEINDDKIMSTEKCKGKSCKYESSNGDDDFRDKRGKNSQNYMTMNRQKYGKPSNDFDMVGKPSKHRTPGRTSTKNLLKNGSSEERNDSDEEETETTSKHRIIKNVIFVKNKLAHLRNKIGGIDSAEVDSGKKNELKKIKKNQIYSKSYQTDEINRNEDSDDSSEEQKLHKGDKRKIKSKSLESEEDTGRKKQRSKSVLSEIKSNQKKSKIIKNDEENDSDEFESMEKEIESDGIVDRTVESDENNNEEDNDNNTCEKIKGERGKEHDDCNDDEAYKEGSILHNRKYKFSIKYAHEKKKVFHNKNDRFVKRIHRVDKKKHRLLDADNDSDEDEEPPKRLHHVADDEE